MTDYNSLYKIYPNSFLSTGRKDSVLHATSHLSRIMAVALPRSQTRFPKFDCAVVFTKRVLYNRHRTSNRRRQNLPKHGHAPAF